MGTQERQLHEDGLVTLNKIALKDHAQAWIKKDMMKSGVALLQPQHEPVLESVDGSLAALRYQGARNASFWVVHKALASLEDNMLKDWAATINIAPSVEALERELKSVKVILEFTLGKVIHNLALEDILMVLGELVYDAEDVLDEMEYFRIQADVLDASRHVDDYDDDDDDDDDDDNRFDRDNAVRRIQHIVEQMQFVRQEVSSAIKLLGSDWSTTPSIAQNRPITISESIERKLYGRELMVKSIIDDITKGKHSREVLTVIPIVGPGGIGKTTHVQHIYHSREVQEYFDVKIWTCVSLNFNVNKLIEEIKRYIPKVDDEISSNGTISELIRQRLKSKRFLLVLDDIWDCSHEDEWKRLLVPFQESQVQGNIIIVTTRFPAQAHIMVQQNDHSIYLQGLDIKQFQELFLQVIFGDDDQSRNDHRFLLETGSMIASRLKGSPLAAKTVGRLLKAQLDLVHWTRILESKEWEHSDGKNDIMPALKLSFEYLPSQLQQCFSYCALFPQDYEFERQELINFWIGQEVLHSSHGENKRVEDIGLSCFTELVNYGFFLEKKGGKDERTCYIIHDLLHELAQKVSSRESISIDSGQSQVSSLQVLPSIRHLSINIDDTSAKDRLTLKNCVADFNTLRTRVNFEKLRTLMIFGEYHGSFVKAFGDLLREAKALRVIFLSGASYDVKDLLHNFYCLIHLRYLRIHSSYRYEARFASRISRFYHMMVIDAKYSDSFYDPLPGDITNLVKLRHLLVQDDSKHCMGLAHSDITEVGKLQSLQELRRFIVKQEDQGFELGQIGHLELCGSLYIDRLENVQLPEEANEAKLMLKNRLHELILCWNNKWSTNDTALEEHVLERLKPSRNLQKLSIIRHRGGTCPSWLGMNLSLSSLKSLCLDDVAWKTFPPIGDLMLVNVSCDEIPINIPEKKFGNLRRLKLVKLSGLKTWAVHAPCQLFPYLEVLIIKDCSQLVELSFSHSAGCCQQGKEVHVKLFPRMKKLKIRNCLQLSSFPPVPWTEGLCSTNIQETSSLGKLVCEEDYDSEYNLTIEGKKDTNDGTSWNVLAFHNLTGLKKLSMCRCQPLPLCYLQMLSSLRALDMSCLSNAFPFVEDDSHVKYEFLVESLTIREWNASGMKLTQLLTYFPKLSYLQLFQSKKVTGLAVNVKRQQVTESPGVSFSASINKVKQQQGARAEDDVIFTSEEAERDLLLLPPQLQKLEIESCPELSLLVSNPHGDSNQDGRAGRGGGIRGLTSLRALKITCCPEVLSNYSSSSFSSSFSFPNSLKYLIIDGAVGKGAQLPLSNLTALRRLVIYECGDLRGEGLWSLLAQGHPTKLYVTATPNFFVDSNPSPVHDQEIPSYSSKLQELEIQDVAGFTTASIRRNLLFSSLTTLEISEDNKVERFTEEQEALLFVDSLEDITFEFCFNLQSLPERLHRLPNLKRSNIWHFMFNLKMLPKDGLPSSLEELDIEGCPNIQSLPKGCLPDSLQKLRIHGCPTILSLPEVDDLPSSLREIDVSGSQSQELKSHCRKLINVIPIVIT